MVLVIIMAAWMMFGDMPNEIYWTFIVGVNVTYHTMEYIIKLRRERNHYELAYNAVLEIRDDLIHGRGNTAIDDKIAQILSRYDDVEDLV